MSRLETIRSYMIERFFTLLTSDAEFAGLTEPSELFDSDGAFNVPLTAAGFVRIPTLSHLNDRIANASSDAQRAALERFTRILSRVLHRWFGMVMSMDAKEGAAAALRLAPILRHPDDQTYWPVDVGRYLAYDDGTLRGQLYSSAGAAPLSGDLYTTLFKAVDTSGPHGAAPRPFESRQPFVATIGVEPGVPSFPATPLTAGRLNLSAAAVRLTPGLLKPAVYAEIKSLAAALRLNRDYDGAARSARFAPLRRNRVHADPLLADLLLPDERSHVAVSALGRDPILIVYHGFYPADDGARRLDNGTGTNREFHHLAVGVLSIDRDMFVGRSFTHIPQGFLFVSTSPTEARVRPLSHPTITFADASGRHPIVYADNVSPQGYGYKAEKVALKESTKTGMSYDPDDPEWWAGLGGAIATGALAGIPGGPIGVAIGAAVGAVIFLLAWLLNKLFGGKKEWTEYEPTMIGDGRPPSYTQSTQNDIAPADAATETGGATPARAYELKMIPHFVDANLYGLAFEGGDTFKILDDPATTELLSWTSFDGGVGYQFDRSAPGRTDVAGSSICNYFELFARKFIQLQEAHNEVHYFGS